MAIFASTTTSGYSDPLKALSIKALEARQKDLLAQQAAQQPDAAMMATIPGGIGHVLGVVGDQMKQARSDQALAANRADLAKAMSGYDANVGMTPEQRGVLARVAPETLDKLLQHEQETRALKTTESGLNTRNAATNATTLENTGLQQKGALERTNIEQAGASGRTSATLGSEEKRATQKIAAEDEQLASKQEQETKMARLNAELAAAQKEHDYAQQNNLQERSAKADENITRLKSELTSTEARKTEAFQNTQLQQKFAQDEKLQSMAQAATAANIAKQIAASTSDKKGQQAADARLEELKIAATARRDELKQAHDAALQTQAEKATSADVGTKVQSAEKIASAEAAAKAQTLATDPKRAEAVRAAETDYRKGLSHIENLEEATKILDHPGGIYTGALQNVAPAASGVPGVNMFVDKEKAQRTSRYNTIVGEDAIRDMSSTLKGSSTNFEMNEFKKMKNDPNISDAARAEQLRRVVKSARADLEAQAKEVKTIGGDVTGVDKTMGKSGAPAADPNAAARKWLEAHPNDPDAPAVRAKLGIK